MAGALCSCSCCLSRMNALALRRCQWALTSALLLLRLVAAQTTVSLPGVLVVLNEPRRGDTLLGGASFAFRVPTYDEAGTFLLYSLRFAPGVARPWPDHVTGDPLQVEVDVERSGPLPAAGGSTPGSQYGTPPYGILYVTAWSYAPYAVAKAWPDGASPAYYNGGDRPLALRAVVWVVTEVCGAPVAGGMSGQEVSEVLFGPPPGAGLRPPGPRPRPPPTNLERFWEACSYGAVRMKAAESLVLELSLPCGGVRANGAAWDLMRGGEGEAEEEEEESEEEEEAEEEAGGGCGKQELWGAMEYAANYTAEALGIDHSPYLRRMLLLPPAAAAATPSGAALCPAWRWGARGSLGCDGARGCDAWIRADRSTLLPAVIAQLAASMGLRPATGPPQQEQGQGQGQGQAGASASTAAAAAASWPPTDPADPMGALQAGYRCFNGPNSFKLGFASAASRLSGANMYMGYQVPLTLPAAATAPANILLVEPSWIPSPSASSSSSASSASASPSAASAPGAPLLFAQYRPALGGDAGLAAPLPRSGALLLHDLNASLRDAGWGPERPTPPTRFLAALQPGESYTYESGKVVVRFDSRSPPPADDPGGVTGGSAALSVCRYAAAAEGDPEQDPEGCWDGLDNDCDGLIDYDDPDCQQREL